MIRREFTLVVLGKPRGQERVRRGPHGHSFKSREQEEYEERMGNVWLSVGAPRLPKGPYVVKVTGVYERAPSHFNRKGELNAHGLRHPFPGYSDVDNLAKQVDALVACGALPDDRHMIALHTSKRWGDQARLIVEARTLIREETDG